MTSADTDHSAVHDAVTAIYVQAGVFPAHLWDPDSAKVAGEYSTWKEGDDLGPTFRDTSDLDVPELERAMLTVAEADLTVVPRGARLDLIIALARVHYPGRNKIKAAYKAMAESIESGVKWDQVLDDMIDVGEGAKKVKDTATGEALKNTSSISFVGEDLCSVKRVMVNGKPAMWVFSEFSTTASFEDVAEWVDPNNWSERASMMFKSMAPEKGSEVTKLQGPGERWHGNYQEEVNFGGKFLVTGLHCDFARTQSYALVTYRWNWSQGNQISVDRGFLMVNDLGKTRQVKVLKVVAFTDPALNQFADTVCPWWTDYIRGAARGGGTQQQAQVHTSQPGTAFLGPNMRKMIGIYRKSALDYVDFVGEFSKGMMSPGYGPSKWVRDTTAYWSELAADWARMWTAGNEIISGMATSPTALDPFGGPSGRDGSESEGTTLPMPDIDVTTEVTCSDLKLIGERPEVIEASRITVELQRLHDGSLGAHIEAATSGVSIGMYVGELIYGPSRLSRPVQLYVSQAVE